MIAFEKRSLATSTTLTIFHDSMGFEPGYIEKSKIVRSFLEGRAECGAKLLDQVHAIW